MDFISLVLRIFAMIKFELFFSFSENCCYAPSLSIFIVEPKKFVMAWILLLDNLWRQNSFERIDITIFVNISLKFSIVLIFLVIYGFLSAHENFQRLFYILFHNFVLGGQLVFFGLADVLLDILLRQKRGFEHFNIAK